MPAAPAYSKILVHMPNWLGDCLMAAPALEGIKRLFPGCAIGILIRESFSGLAALLPFVDAAIGLPPDRRKRRSVISSLRGNGYEAAVILPNSFRSAWEMWRTGIPVRIGYAGQWRSWLLTHPQPRPARHSLHQERYYTRLVQGVYPGIETRQLRLSIPEEEMEKAAALLPSGARPIAGLGFGASYGSAKMWPAERFAGLIDRLSESADVVLFGAESDRGVETKVLELARSKPRSLVGKTDIPTLAAAFSRLDLYITNDTGPMHLAAAAGAPVLAIFGPTSPEETKPAGDNVTLLYHGADCAPCWRRECPADHRCMTAITVDEAHAAAMKILDRSGAR